MVSFDQRTACAFCYAPVQDKVVIKGKSFPVCTFCKKNIVPKLKSRIETYMKQE